MLRASSTNRSPTSSADAATSRTADHQLGQGPCPFDERLISLRLPASFPLCADSRRIRDSSDL